MYFYLSWIELAPSGMFRTKGEKYWLEKTRKNLQLVLITLNGLKLNIWSEGLVDVSPPMRPSVISTTMIQHHVKKPVGEFSLTLASMPAIFYLLVN